MLISLLMDQDNFPDRDRDEQLRAENDFLKMKLMLENGAEFHKVDGGEIDPEIEHHFLNYIQEFERQMANPVLVKIFDKVGQPAQFRDCNLISDEEMETEWNTLHSFLESHGVHLDVCSPNISDRELYRFVTEELFAYEIEDLKIPGMTTGFIYDEFHPDAVYDNERTARIDCIGYILEKRPMEWMHNFFDNDLSLNDRDGLLAIDFRNHVNDFKAKYTDIDLADIEVTDCDVNDQVSIVKGKYNVLLTWEAGSELRSGNWRVVLNYYHELGYWQIRGVSIEGIEF